MVVQTFDSFGSSSSKPHTMFLVDQIRKDNATFKVFQDGDSYSVECLYDSSYFILLENFESYDSALHFIDQN